MHGNCAIKQCKLTHATYNCKNTAAKEDHATWNLYLTAEENEAFLLPSPLH